VSGGGEASIEKFSFRSRNPQCRFPDNTQRHGQSPRPFDIDCRGARGIDGGTGNSASARASPSTLRGWALGGPPAHLSGTSTPRWGCSSCSSGMSTPCWGRSARPSWTSTLRCGRSARPSSGTSTPRWGRSARHLGASPLYRGFLCTPGGDEHPPFKWLCTPFGDEHSSLRLLCTPFGDNHLPCAPFGDENPSSRPLCTPFGRQALFVGVSLHAL